MKRIVKVGGSVITNKNSKSDPKINFEVLNKLPEAEAYVFGVGSFGHGRALELGLTEEFAEVVIEDFDSELKRYYDLVRSAFKLDKPIYFGGIKMKGGLCRIVSGDEIVVKLALEKDFDEILYITETGGVEMKDGSLVTEFDGSEVSNVILNMKKVDFVDASGGMQGKLQKILDFGFGGRVKFSKI